MIVPAVLIVGVKAVVLIVGIVAGTPVVGVMVVLLESLAMLQTFGARPVLSPVEAFVAVGRITAVAVGVGGGVVGVAIVHLRIGRRRGGHVLCAAHRGSSGPISRSGH